MKYILLFVILFFAVSCSDSNQGGTGTKCSEQYPTGKCEDDLVCINGVCIDTFELCSEDNPTGKCETGKYCKDGVCELIGEECSVHNPNGTCEEGKVCQGGQCITISNACSLTNPDGDCPNGKRCVEGYCSDITEPCSVDYPDGLCETDYVCLNAKCVLEIHVCSLENPTGICRKGEYCSLGICLPVECNTGEAKKCYPSSNYEIGKGICREGVQLCIDNKWGFCEGAVTPVLEECNGFDDNCNGAVDDGVKNKCGSCGPEPEEIQGNNFDDDCDNLIDEDENNQGGLNGCDDRIQQPCYTGPAGTSGKGTCKGGLRDCQPDNRWGTCVGQVTPQNETCDDNIDNDCDGLIDEFCDSVVCLDEELCNNSKDDNCNNLVNENCSVIDRDECEATEICDDGFDNDCNGIIDEGCSCNGLSELGCYSGDPSDLNEGTECKKGKMTCIGGEFWSNCVGETLPLYEICDGKDNNCNSETDEESLNANTCGICFEITPLEICSDNIDNDCDDLINENCSETPCVPTEEICDEVDNDCDGLVDEGVVNACGKCNESCYVIEIAGETDINKGVFDGVSNSINPNEITLDSSTVQNNFVWVANGGSDTETGNDTVTKINSLTGEVYGHFVVGDYPSRTAVESDGSVWVANRHSHSITKLASTGMLQFTVELDEDCQPRGVALDKDGNAWVGCFGIRGEVIGSDGYVYKINPQGQIFEGYPFDTNIPIYGLAIDKRGFLWNSRLDDFYSCNNDPSLNCATQYAKIFKIDTNKNTIDAGFFKSFPFSHQVNGMVVDKENNIWFAGWADNDIKKVVYNEISDTISVTTYPAVYEGEQLSGARGIAIDSNDNIWASFSYSNKIAKFDKNGNILGAYFCGNNTHPVGVGVDSDDQIWVTNYLSNNVIEFNQDGTIARTRFLFEGAAPYSYSDFTGYNLKNIVSLRGNYQIIIDTARTENDAIFDSLEWEGDTPNGSSIVMRARVANIRNDFMLDDSNQNAPKWSDFINSSGNSLGWSNGGTNTGRYIQIEAVLSVGSSENDKPKLRRIWVNWQRP